MSSFMKKLNISKKLSLGYGLILVILVVLSLVTYVDFSQYSNADSWNVHTYKVISDLQSMQESMINMETGQRGYSLTGSDNFLEPFNAGKTSFDQYYNEVKSLTSDNPNEQANIQKILSEKENWLQVAQKSIALRKGTLSNQNTMDDVIKFEEAAQGKASMDNIRVYINKSLDMENTLLNQRSASAGNLENITILVLTLGTLIAILLAILISRTITKDINGGIKKIIAASDKLAKGDIEIELDADRNDEFGKLSKAFGNVVNSIQQLIVDTNMLAGAASEGKLDIRAEASKHQGDYRKIVNGFNNTLDLITLPIKVSAEYVDKISKGIIPEKIATDYKGDFNIIKVNLNNCIDIMNGLLSETRHLIDAMKQGQLSTRGNAEVFSGGWGELVLGVNELIDAFVAPINETSEYIQQISKGKIPEKISTTYLGDFNEIKNNLNSCIDTMTGLLEETNSLIIATKKGELDARGNADVFSGDWRNLVRGVNELIDAFVAPIRVTSEYVSQISKGLIPQRITEPYLGDFNLIKNSLNNCVDIMNGLLNETNSLINASLEGKLSYRADDTKFEGGWNELVSGINKMLDAVILPVKEASDVLVEMSRGNLHVKVTGEYMGDHAAIKNALNSSLETLSEYVNSISSVLSELAKGNLDINITTDYIGDFVVIKHSFNTIINSLNEVMGNLSIAAEQVSDGSKQVSNGSQALSQGATEQASSLEELTSSITEISSQTKQNAVNATKVSTLVNLTQEEALQGTKKMSQMLSSMQEINESSVSISKINKVIDDIAFQTNILALNAAVEAARAGQYGKGFAVVAEEVRNLAAKSAAAAKETTALIESSIIKVENGSKIASETADTLTKISDSIKEVTALAGNIAVASNEQANAITQIDQGLTQVSTVVQTNSATAEESAASSEELSGQADILSQMVNRFILKN